MAARRTPRIPAVIAHRGASAHRPEHTLGSYELAYTLGADSVELDVVATRDGVLVCLHDVELSATTDVADHKAFADRKRTLEVEGEPVTGWFVHDFDFFELRELRTRERWPRKRAASAAYDGRWPVPTVAEVIELRDFEAARSGRRLGVHLELKTPQHLRRHGLWLPDLIAEAGVDVATDLTFMSFDDDAIRAIDSPRRYRLFDKSPAPRELGRVAEYADGIGVRRRAILPKDIVGRVGEPSKLVEKAHRRGLEVLVWTHRPENQHLPSNLRIGSDPHGHGDAAGEAALLYAAGIGGLITDIPEVAIVGRNRLPGLPVAH
ncbi:MAG: glycerophosphodiester phosphodiesterase family protein [Marmoricola sp.]